MDLQHKLGWVGILVGVGSIGLTAFVYLADPSWISETWRPAIAIGGLCLAVVCLTIGGVILCWSWVREWSFWPRIRRVASRVRIPFRVVRVVEREPRDAAATTPGLGHRATAPTNTQPTVPTSTQPRADDDRPPFADDPRQLLDYLYSLPLLQRDDALRRYRGLEVVWRGELQSLWTNSDGEVELMAWFDRDKRRYFRATVPRVAGLESLNEGDEVKVTGRIDYLLYVDHQTLSSAQVIF